MDLKKIALGLTLAVIVVIGGNEYRLSREQVKQDDAPVNRNPKSALVPMMIGETSLMVEIRDTDRGRMLGLSYRDTLPENEGMLFVFSEALPLTFIMREMRFDLDMIWIRDKRVVDISARVPAPTDDNPIEKTVSPMEKADMVLEVNSGWSEKHGIQIGDRVDIPYPPGV